MQNLSCKHCGNRVLVEKYSPTHTSIQWLSDAETACPEFAQQAALGVPSIYIPTCSALRDSIEQAAHEGIVETDAPRSYPVPGRLM
ncbi:hypothetical protein [Rhodococcus sp. 1168]|uniref:hypothetical protein n=1 Tax=Rhodococcus sp. 1168 TaxID=2018041 RepID=UPI000A0DA5AF|nr:hypothetical protein [Rhodococcus sp. 1168]ORI15532.1 hypothetical protein BJI47_14370 [Rhodococcus sp. 1168]